MSKTKKGCSKEMSIAQDFEIFDFHIHLKSEKTCKRVFLRNRKFQFSVSNLGITSERRFN